MSIDLRVTGTAAASARSGKKMEGERNGDGSRCIGVAVRESYLSAANSH